MVRAQWRTPHGLDRAAFVDGLFEGIQNEPGMRGAADPPAHDASGIGVDDECDIDEAFPSGDIGEIRNPEHVGRRHAELAVHAVQRARQLFVRDRGLVRLATDNPLNIHGLHQPRDRAAGHIEALPPQLSPDLAHAVDLPVGVENAPDVRPKLRIPPGTV